MIVIKEKIEVIPVIAGEIQGWLEKHLLFYYFEKSFFCAKLQIVKLYIEKVSPARENLEIYAHLNICLHLARWRGEKSGDFFIWGSHCIGPKRVILGGKNRKFGKG